MSLNIKNPETERLARELAKQAGESVTRAVTVALKERLDRMHAHHLTPEERVERTMEIARDAVPRWVEPWKSTPHGDLLYDERGLPR